MICWITKTQQILEHGWWTSRQCSGERVENSLFGPRVMDSLVHSFSFSVCVCLGADRP